MKVNVAVVELASIHNTYEGVQRDDYIAVGAEFVYASTYMAAKDFRVEIASAVKALFEACSEGSNEACVAFMRSSPCMLIISGHGCAPYPENKDEKSYDSLESDVIDSDETVQRASITDLLCLMPPNSVVFSRNCYSISAAAHDWSEGLNGYSPIVLGSERETSAGHMEQIGVRIVDVLSKNKSNICAYLKKVVDDMNEKLRIYSVVKDDQEGFALLTGKGKIYPPYYIEEPEEEAGNDGAIDCQPPA